MKRQTLVCSMNSREGSQIIPPEYGKAEPGLSRGRSGDDEAGAPMSRGAADYESAPQVIAAQYFGTLGSTLSLQARMPPTTLRTCWKPFWRRTAQALALRMPLLQWITMSAVGIELAHVLRELAQRNQLRAGNAADLVLVRLAHVDQHEVVAAIDLLLHFRTSISPSFTLVS